MSEPGRIVVAGGGLAAVAACAELRAAGYGGEVVLVGAEDTVPYDRPPLSKQVLAGEMEAAGCALHPEVFYRDHAIRLELGRPVAAVDARARQVELADGRRIGYDRLLLATGGRARRLPPAVAGERPPEGVHALRTLSDARALRGELVPGRRLVVIGGGFLGLEVAATARAAGLDVVVIEAGGALLGGRIHAAAAAWLAARHRAAGITILAGAAVAALAGRPRIAQVRLADGRRLDCDLCVEAIGMAPDTALAGSAGAAVEAGILTAASGETGVPGICAAGDAASCFDPRYARHLRLESWQAARQQGQACARSMLGLPAPAPDVPWFWSSQLGAMMHMAGLPDAGERIIVRGSRVDARFVVFGMRAGVVTSLFAVNAMADARLGKDLIGRAVAVDADALADPAVRLRDLLRTPAEAAP